MDNVSGLRRATWGRRLWVPLGLAWLAVSAVAALFVSPALGLFLAWAGLALAAFFLRPFPTMLGILVLRIAASDWAEAFVVLPGTPYSINQAGLANFVLLGLALLYLVWKRPKLGPLTWPFVAFLVAGLISIPFSARPLEGLRDWSRLAPLFAAYLVFAGLLRGSQSRARTLIWAVVASSIVPNAVAIYQWVTGTGYHNVVGVNRLLGTLGHPIGYGTFLGIVFVLTIYLTLHTQRSSVRLVLAALALMDLVLLFATYSRGPMLALVAGLLAVAVLSRRERAPVRLGLAAVAVAFLALAVLGGRTEDLQRGYTYRDLTPQAATTPAPQPTRPPVGAPGQSAPGAQPAIPSGPILQPGIVYGVNSLSWRLNLWRFGIDLVREHPITGIGLGSFPGFSPRLIGWETTPHNDFVRVLVEMGLLGLLTYVALWAALAWGLFGMWRGASDRGPSWLWAAVAGVAVVYLVNSLSVDLLNYPALGWLFWSLAALPQAFRAHTA